MNYTKQEEKNHRNFIISILSQFFFLGLIGWSINNDEIILGTIGISGIILNTIWMFYIGYSHGWELKRISLN